MNSHTSWRIKFQCLFSVVTFVNKKPYISLTLKDLLVFPQTKNHHTIIKIGRPSENMSWYLEKTPIENKVKNAWAQNKKLF